MPRKPRLSNLPDPLPLMGDSSFEGLKRTNEHGAEYWSARDLQPLMGYTQWRRFEQALERAQRSCAQSGNDPMNHFAGAGKMVPLGSGSVRDVPDFHLSRSKIQVKIEDAARKEGLQEGLREGLQETARRMLAEGFAWEVVTRITGLSPEDLAG